MLRIRVSGSIQLFFQSQKHPSFSQKFTRSAFLELSENHYSRFLENPPLHFPLLLQVDAKNPVAVARRYSDIPGIPGSGSYQLARSGANQAKKEYVKITPTKNRYEKTNCIFVPNIPTVTRLAAQFDNNGELLLQARTLDLKTLHGRPLCQIKYSPKEGTSQTYLFYSLKMADRYTPAPLSIPRFNDSTEAKKLAEQKGGKFKQSKEQLIDNMEVPKRTAIVKRSPDQNQVMRIRAVDAYRNCVDMYKKCFNPQLNKMMSHSANIFHLSTLAAMQKREERIRKEIMDNAHKFKMMRPEWLHLLAFFSHPMHENPQVPHNLGAARACHNTRMMLLEYTIRWLALNVKNSENRLKCKFDFLLDSEVIDTIHLTASTKINETQCELTQSFDALQLDPEQISASDLAYLGAILSMLMDNKKPELVHEVPINSTVAQPFPIVPPTYDHGFFNKHVSLVSNKKLLKRTNSLIL